MIDLENQIDQLVSLLYELTEEEIKIIESKWYEYILIGTFLLILVWQFFGSLYPNEVANMASLQEYSQLSGLYIFNTWRH